MRRALGLSPGSVAQTPQQRPEQARQRHRFVQDGGVPVVMLHKPDPDLAGLRERIGSLESMLEAERSAHAGTRRLLSEQQAAHQALQTRHTHAELAHREALASERAQREAAQLALAELQASAAASPLPRAPAPTLAVASLAPAEPTEPPKVRKARIVTATGEPPKRGRPRINPIPEPKPLRWWTPSFKARTKA